MNKTSLPVLLLALLAAALTGPGCKSLHYALRPDSEPKRKAQLKADRAKARARKEADELMAEIMAELNKPTPTKDYEVTQFVGFADPEDGKARFRCDTWARREAEARGMSTEEATAHKDEIRDDCFAKVHTRGAEVWRAIIDQRLKAGRIKEARDGAITLLQWMFHPWWRGDKRYPTQELENIGAALAKADQARFRATGTYLEGASTCVASVARPRGARKAVGVRYHFRPDDTVYLRCYLQRSLSERMQGLTKPTVFAAVQVWTDKDHNAKRQEIPFNLRRFRKKKVIDTSFSLAQYAKGARVGQLFAQITIRHIRGYEKKWDDVQKRVLLLPIYGYIPHAVRLTFSD